jgi:WD40 repeat protein/energy-coupling factor transporter ATP-binding protein EcfA2
VAKVFISHATEDDTGAELVHGWLVEDGHEAFLDHDLLDGIELGEEWERRLHERLRWADAVVCLITSAYVASAWCTTELGVARSWGRRLLPISVDPGVTHPMLPSVQYADLAEGAEATRKALRTALARLDAAAGWAWPDGRSPFPGLEAFDGERHRVFFGRKEEVAEIAGLLRSPAEQARGEALFLVGPSGCGKSSLVRAGLLPLMQDEPGWRCLPPIIPGPDPVAALISELVPVARAAGVDADQVQSWIAEDNLARVVLATGGRLLVFVDQFEELLTRADPEARRRFAELLGPSLQRSVRLMATLRPEFLGPLLDSPDLAALAKRVHPISPLRRDALRSVITEPSRLAGLRIEDDLVERLVSDTDDGRALPLLAYTLAELSRELGRGDRLLMSRYVQLDGVQGALVTQAGKALAEARAVTGRTEQDVLRGLLRLVTVDADDQPARLRVPVADLPEVTVSELRPFVDRRLLITETEDDQPVIGVAHEAFLSAWPPVREAIERTATGLRARNAVEQAARQWDQEERPVARLWERGQLAAALADTGSTYRRSGLVSERIELSASAARFLHASARRDRRLRRRAVVVLSTLLVLALTAAVVAVIQQRAAVDQQRIAASRQLIAQADGARATDPRTALLLGIGAERLKPGAVAESNLVDTLTHTKYSRTLAHDSEVVSTAVSPNGGIVATGTINGLVRLWDIRDPTRPGEIGGPLTGHTSYVYSVAFAPDGRTVASAGADGVVILWDITDPTRAHRIGDPLTGHTAAVRAAVFAPQGGLLATAGSDRAVILWDVTDPARPKRVGAPLIGHTDAVTTIAFTPDGRTMATAGFDKGVVLWDVRNPAATRRIGGSQARHANVVWALAFSPDGRLLASGSADGTVGLWDVSDPAGPRGLTSVRPEEGGQIFSVAFRPDGRTLAAAGSGKTVTLWNTTNPTALALRDQLVGHTNSVYSVAFTPDGRTAVTGAADKTAVLWDLDGPPQPRRLTGPGPTGGALNALTLAPDGRTAATADADGSIGLWDVGGAEPRRLGPPIAGRDGAMWSVAFSADGRTLAGAANDGTVQIWNISDPGNPRRADAPVTGPTGPVYAVALSADGRMMAAAGADSRIRLWDMSNPAGPRRLGDDLRGHAGSIYALAFTANGRILVSAGADNSVILWNVADPEQPQMMGAPLIGHTGPVYSLAFAANGTRLASADGNGAILLWDLTDPARPRTVGRPLLGHTGAVYRIAFSGDGRTLISGGADRTALLWDLSDTDQPRRLGPPLTAHSGPVNGVAFSGDGSRLETAGGDGLLVMWDLAALDHTRERPLETACAVTGRGLTRDEWTAYLPGLDYQDTCAA